MVHYAPSCLRLPSLSQKKVFYNRPSSISDQEIPLQKARSDVRSTYWSLYRRVEKLPIACSIGLCTPCPSDSRGGRCSPYAGRSSRVCTMAKQQFGWRRRGNSRGETCLWSVIRNGPGIPLCFCCAQFCRQPSFKRWENCNLVSLHLPLTALKRQLYCEIYQQSAFVSRAGVVPPCTWGPSSSK